MRRLLTIAVLASTLTSGSVAARTPNPRVPRMFHPWNTGGTLRALRVRPVAGRIVRGFVAPPNPYGRGHRGVDFAITRNETVQSVGSGTVVFSGVVAGQLHVVVQDVPSGWLIGYSFLASVAVRMGQSVAPGQPVGTAGGGRDPNHGPGVLHVSLRIAGQYVDPTQLWTPVDLRKVVHLGRLPLRSS